MPRKLYQLPSDFGGHRLTGFICGCLDSTTVELDLGAAGTMHLPASLLVEVTPDEPAVGTVAIDAAGDVWHHKDDLWWWGNQCITWAVLYEKHGPLTELGAAAPAAEPGPLVRHDLVEPLPMDLTSDGPSGRVLSIDHAKVRGYFKFQVVEGQQFGRAAIIAYADAEAAAWSILAAVYGQN